MSLISMTGYGRGEASAGGIKAEAELSSVNRKQFDMRLNLPRNLLALESRIRDVVQKQVSRGMITGAVRITVQEKAKTRAVVVDRKVAGAYVKELRKAARELGLTDDLSARALLSLPDVLQSRSITDDTGKVWRILKRALSDAVRELLVMRQSEGAALAKDIETRMGKLKRYAAGIRKRAPTVPKRYQEQLRKRLGKLGVEVNDHDPSVLREICLFAERCDISEELVRLESHFKQTAKTCTSKDPVGRSLDFLCQEMFREINTIGSKANDTAISKLVIQFKTELECIREQVQNVE